VKRICILGGSPNHKGGLEAFCERAEQAIVKHSTSMTAIRLPTRTAYPGIRDATGIAGTLAKLVRQRSQLTLVWLQVSNLGDLLFVPLLKALGLAVLVTPHFGINSRLQTVSWRRRLCNRILGQCDRVALLFEDQANEIALPLAIPRDTLGSFLPEGLLHAPTMIARDESDNDSWHLLHAGRFSEEKGTLLAVEVAAMLHERGFPVQLHLVGRGDPQFMQKLNTRIAETSMKDATKITAWLDEPDMKIALAEADVLLHLSSLDSFPLIVLEALAADTLPVIWPMPGGRAMVSIAGGHVVETSEPARQAANWIAAQDLFSLRAAGREAGRLTREAFGWSALVNRLEGIIART